MALTAFQIKILRLLSNRRKREGVSYIAGGVALNKALDTPRRSRDIDVFHDTTEALAAAWTADRRCIENAGFLVEIHREAPSFIEATIGSKEDSVLIQWVRDSAFRFFPVIEDEILGLTLHPFDLATNKILALAGRLEPRDWIDTIECHRSLQPLGYLVWASCGKDPGLNPSMLLAEASRAHYSQPEINALDFAGNPPPCAELSSQWKHAVSAARETVDLLPGDHLGECIVNAEGMLYHGDAHQLVCDLKKGSIRFHKGSIGGVWPRLVRR
ncbi:MAG: hypothetical protein GF418_03205 [Chitinivibrionales bacterium]|nr:hypothetical protein [Chitinivibrionales bacterium]MBD3394610.1 hypothetical protein [Chitinivibrionales bacterium]